MVPSPGTASPLANAAAPVPAAAAPSDTAEQAAENVGTCARKRRRVVEAEADGMSDCEGA